MQVEGERGVIPWAQAQGLHHCRIIIEGRHHYMGYKMRADASALCTAGVIRRPSCCHASSTQQLSINVEAAVMDLKVCKNATGVDVPCFAVTTLDSKHHEQTKPARLLPLCIIPYLILPFRKKQRKIERAQTQSRFPSFFRFQPCVCSVHRVITAFFCRCKFKADNRALTVRKKVDKSFQMGALNHPFC